MKCCSVDVSHLTVVDCTVLNRTEISRIAYDPLNYELNIGGSALCLFTHAPMIRKVVFIILSFGMRLTTELICSLLCTELLC